MMASQLTEILSTANSSQNMGDYNGWFELDRTTLLSTNIGAVEQIGCKLSQAGNWYPVIGRKVTPHGGTSYEVIYRHPTAIAHPGDGNFQWVSLPVPLRLLAGEHYAGAYFTGFSSGSTPMVLGRAEVNANPSSGIVSLTEYANWQTPAMGVRYYGEAGDQVYACAFDRGLDGWSAYATVQNTAGEFRSSGDFTNDFNHHTQNAGDPLGIGKTLSLLAYRFFEIDRFDGSFYKPDFTGARIEARIRLDSWSAPSGTEILLWAQSRGASFNSNWALSGSPLTSYADGAWHDIDITLPSAESGWTFGGGILPSYGHLSLAATLANLQNIIFVAARPIGSAKPTGTFRMDSVRITYPA